MSDPGIGTRIEPKAQKLKNQSYSYPVYFYTDYLFTCISKNSED